MKTAMLPNGTGLLEIRGRGSPCQNGRVDIVPVRLDGTGRLVAIGLIEVMDFDGMQRWTTISTAALPDESADDAIERGLWETLGPNAHGHRSKGRPVWSSRRDGRLARAEATSQLGVVRPTAVEIFGRFEPGGGALRFSWFLITALPAHEDIQAAQRPVLADFLAEQGEPGLAGRLRGF